MNRLLVSVSLSLLSAGAGFVLAWTAGRSLMPGAAPPSLTATLPVKMVPAPITELPPSGHFLSLSPAEKVSLSQRFPRLDAAQRAQWLADAMERPEPERTSCIALIMLDWAQVDPAAAGEWALGELRDDCRIQCFHDIVESWAASGAKGLPEWWNGMATCKAPPQGAGYLQGAVQKRLSYHNPLAHARFQELPCVKNPYSGAGDQFTERHLSTPQKIAAMAAAVTGNVSYNPDPADLRSNLERESLDRHADKKNVWNSIFEETAMAWHRNDPAACDTWLQTFPENAQLAARHFIEKDETTRAIRPAVPVPESPAPQPVMPAQRLTSAPPVPGPAENAARQEWSNWWRADAAAAGTFLNTAAWADDQKFRARAKAYSSAP